MTSRAMAEPPEAGHKRVGVWIRVSTEDQARGESPANHEHRARMYAAAKGWMVAELYDLSGVSGKSVMDHPEARRMLADLREKRITGLIFSKLARLARNTRELLDFSEIFEECEADLISLQESIDTSTPSGRLFYTMIAAMAQWEREEIADRVAASVPVRAKLGKNTGGQASFGYQWVDGKLVPHPEEAPVRKLVYELFLEYRRRKTVARRLNARGFRTRNGSEFSDTTITRLLRDPTAKGEHRANYTTSRGRGKSTKLKDRREWVIQPVEPIVSAEVWDECNAILDQITKLRRPPGPRSQYLFTGKVHCGCGAKMYVRANTPSFRCNGCNNTIPKDDLEAVFRDELRRFLFSDVEVGKAFVAMDEHIAGKQAEIGALDSERSKVLAEREKMYRSYVEGGLDTKPFSERYNELTKRLEAINGELPAIQAELDVLKISRLSNEDVLMGARDLYSRWDTLSHGEKASIIETITERIVVGEKEIEIFLHYVAAPPKPDGTSPNAGGSAGANGSAPASQNGVDKATQSQGFIAAINWKRAG